MEYLWPRQTYFCQTPASRHVTTAITIRLMVYVCCYSDEFKFFKLSKEKKGGRKRGNLLDLPAPKSEVFLAVRQLQWAEKERRIRNQVDWLKHRRGDSSLFLPGIKPNRVKRPANHIQDIELRPKPIIRKVRSCAILGRILMGFFFPFPLSSSILGHLSRNNVQSIHSLLVQCIGHSVYFYWA
jgi:hypothetical protein